MKLIAQSDVRKALTARLPAAASDRSPSMLSGLMTSGGGHVFTRSSGMFDLLGREAKEGNNLVGVGGAMRDDISLPDDRFLKYPLLEEMATYPTLATALNIHLTHALSYDKKTNSILTFQPLQKGGKADVLAAQKICEELNSDLGSMLNENIALFAQVAAVLGVSFIRPHAEPGVGILSLECNYYTLPQFIREYHIGGQLAGFTGDYLKSEYGGKVLAEPWDLIPMRIAGWRPRATVIPTYSGAESYNLLGNPMARTPTETQNYGCSLIEPAFESYENLKEAIRAVRSARMNSAKIDRLLSVAMNSLDPAQAAKYQHTISHVLKRSADLMEGRAMRGRWSPTVTNTVIPVLGDGKQQMGIDTFSIDPNISGIDDVMMYLKMMAGSVGLDYSLLGWADQMSGGLGEGGFLRTSIQAAARSQWIRMACETSIHRTVDIHMAYKYGKVWTPQDRPYSIRFNSANTALQQEENDAADSRANYASVVTTIIDAISNNDVLSKSETFKQLLFGNILNLGDDVVVKLITEIKKASDNDEHKNLFESLLTLDEERRSRVLGDV